MSWHDSLEVCPRCGQDYLYPVSLPEFACELDLCGDCEMIRYESGETATLATFRGDRNLSDWSTPIICRLTFLNLQDPQWEATLQAHLDKSAK